jgi:acyl-coenzyme A synthetase/AMP-(fatty) acid ligase
MTTLPLVAHFSPDSIIAWRSRDRDAVTLQQFLADVNQLVSLFPAGSHMLNMCSDRYHFSVGLAAAIVANKISLLPSTHTPEVIRQIKAFAPDVFCLTDNKNCNVDLPQLAFPTALQSETSSFEIPQINCEQCVAIVFTSGSTGAPKPHPKTWQVLINSIQAEALRIGLQHHSATTLISTVPPQHMYGLESSVLIAWFTGNALCDAQPFYPADVCQTLNAVPSPRMLVSSPVHLRTLLDADLIIPKVDQVLSATAPLAIELAQKVESRCNAPLFEIYGSTETGLIATRRSSQTQQWQLLPEIHLIVQDEKVYAVGGHIKTPTIMNDVFDAITQTHFLLRGRVDDMINIAGRRHSLACLNHILNAIPGVIDGAFYMPDESDDNSATTRLAACVVAPELNATQLLATLRDYIAPVFLPRPLLFVDKLPRNETGKLSRASLHDLFQSAHLGKTHE